MSESKRFEYESYQTPAEAKEQFLSILDGLENGRIFLATEGQDIVLIPQSLLRVSIKAKRKDDESRLVFKITWKDAKPDTAATGQSILIRS